MKLSAPKNLTCIIAVVLGVYGLLGYFVTALPFSFWALAIGFVLLAVATFIDGL